MNATQTARLRNLEKTLTLAAGVPVEITIRGERSFTWSFEGKNEAAAAALVAAATQLNDGTTAEVDVIDLAADRALSGEVSDAPHWYTCVYVEAAEF